MTIEPPPACPGSKVENNLPAAGEEGLELPHILATSDIPTVKRTDHQLAGDKFVATRALRVLPVHATTIPIAGNISTLRNWIFWFVAG